MPKLDPNKACEALKRAPLEDKANLVKLFIKKMSESFGRYGCEVREDLTEPCVHLITAPDREVRPMLGEITPRMRDAALATMRAMGDNELTLMFEAIYGKDRLAVFTMLLAEEMGQMAMKYPDFLHYLKRIETKTENSMSTEQEKQSVTLAAAESMKPGSIPPPLSTLESALKKASFSDLLIEVTRRGDALTDQITKMEDAQDAVEACMKLLDDRGEVLKGQLQQVVNGAEKGLKDLAASTKDSVKITADASREACQKMTDETRAACLDRVTRMETDCLARVEAVEAQFKIAVDAITKECAQRAESAEQETLLCIERADQAVASANALGASFNTLNERLHELEVGMRAFFRSGMSPAPVYSPVAASAPVSPVAIVQHSLPPKAENVVPINGKRRDEDDGHKMTFVLIGLHQKNIEHIMQRLRKPTARHVELIVVENTATDKLPKHADYCIVGGDHDLNRRWAFALETYGLTKCIRLLNNSVVSYREKIEEIYEAHHPFSAPTNLGSVGQALIKAM